MGTHFDEGTQISEAAKVKSQDDAAEGSGVGRGVIARQKHQRTMLPNAPIAQKTEGLKMRVCSEGDRRTGLSRLPLRLTTNQRREASATTPPAPGSSERGSRAVGGSLETSRGANKSPNLRSYE